MEGDMRSNRKSIRLMTAALVGAVLCVVALVTRGQGGAAELLQWRLTAAADRGEVLPIETIQGRSPAIDGDLSDWGDLTRGIGAIAQDVDAAPGLVSNGGTDAAAYWMRRDDTALYLAVRVHDESVVLRDPVYEGDSIQLFLDVRAKSGSGHHLGDSDWSDGVYQLIVAAPTS